jgi:AraC family transcriptional regulator of adaptative response/methylated-DNA-[protein]-cysteine methyltransferase
MMNEKIINCENLDEWRWQIVNNKNTEFDGAFFYGVRTTGIYCLPSCLSKRPKRDNVMFFSSFKDAENKGFRACLRCRPQNGKQPNPQIEIIQKACRFIESNLEFGVSLEDLSAETGLSPAYLQKTFKSVLGVSPKQFAEANRLQNFKKQIQKSGDVTQAMYEAGFGSSRALYEKALENLGMTPAVYKKGGKGMKIFYTIVDSILGNLLVAATVKGICSVMFSDDKETLEANLKKEFWAAEITPDEKTLTESVTAILSYLSGQQKTLDLPLDLHSTAFQIRVWAELRKIPYGETRSYREIAEQIGQPTASRAIARTCATNPVALVNPCHRVVRGNGVLSGYRWGIERKKALLEKEKQMK